MRPPAPDLTTQYRVQAIFVALVDWAELAPLPALPVDPTASRAVALRLPVGSTHTVRSNEWVGLVVNVRIGSLALSVCKRCTRHGRHGGHGTACSRRWKEHETAETTREFNETTGLLGRTFAAQKAALEAGETRGHNALRHMMEENRANRSAACPAGSAALLSSALLLSDDLRLHCYADRSGPIAYVESLTGKTPSEFEMLSNLTGFLAGVGNSARLISIG